MNTNLIGEQIAKYRKAAGLTQEELGKAAGVSTQAVSRWECGGAPDVALLPAIADRLHVTVDALFGRESGPAKDISNELIQWLRSLPEKDRLTGLTRLLWDATIYGVCDDLASNIPSIGFPENAEMDMLANARRVMLRTVTGIDSGYIMGVGAEDYAYFGVFPEPEAGYERYFASDDEYRVLFGALAQPGVMETLRFFCRNEQALYSAAAVAQRTGRPLPETERALEALAEDTCQLNKREIILPEGPVTAYAFLDDGGLVVLLTFARWVLQGHNLYLCTNSLSTQPFEREEEENEKA